MYMNENSIIIIIIIISFPFQVKVEVQGYRQTDRQPPLAPAQRNYNIQI